MDSITLTPAQSEEVLPLFTEYTNMLLRESPAFGAYLAIQHYDEELRHPEAKYGPPDGRLYLARCNGEAAGCIALRKLDQATCEMKRLYVRPAFRGRGIASRLVRQILDDARTIGYRRMRLDTLPFLRDAIAFYRRLGFYDIPCYNDSPMAETIFLQLDL